MIYLSTSIGDSDALEIPLTWHAAPFTPGNDWGLIFTAKLRDSDPDADALIQKTSGAGITVSGSTATIALVPADTLDLDPQTLTCDVQAQHLTTGEIRTIPDIRLQLKRDITRATTTSIPVHTTEEPLPIGGSVWGAITGDLEDQADLQAALDAISSSGVPDGNKGSITVSGTGTTWTINTGAVTNDMLAGSIEDGKISSASTWNGKQSALVSGTNIKTINGQSILGSGDLEVAGADPTPTDLAGGTELTINEIYFDTFTANRTLTFAAGTPANGDSIELTFDATGEVVLTIPTSYRIGDTGTTTSITFPQGNHIIKWQRRDGKWYVADSAWEATSDTTAPTLTSISGTQTGDTTATLAVTTDEGNGTLYWFVSTSGTPPNATDLKAGTGAAYAASESVISTGAKSESATGLTASTAYYVHALHRDSAGNESTIATSSSFTTASEPDTTAPTLSAVSATVTGTTTATLNATTDEGNGSIFWYVSTSATPPSASDLIDGTGAVFSAGAAVTSTGAKTASATGLTAATTYYLHVLHEDAAANQSSIATSSSFTTDAADVTAPTLSSATIGTNGTTLTLVFSETVVVGVGGNGGFNVDASTGGADVTCTYVSGSGSDTLVYTLGTTILSGETCDLDYTQPGNGIEDSAGNDLASITSAAVTNNSTQTAGGIADPTEIANLALWLDADDASTLYDANTGGALADPDDEVGRWVDKSSNGHIFLNATVGARPLRKENIINSRDALLFDGSNDRLSKSAGVSLSNSFTMFFVVQRTTGTGYQVMLAVSSTHEITLNSNKTNFYIGSAKLSTATQSTATPYVIGIRVTAGAIEFFLDGVADGTNSGASAQSWKNIGYNGGAEFLNGYMGEIVIYDAALSDPDMSDVTDYLLTRWKP